MRNKHILLATDFSDAWADRLPEIAQLFTAMQSTVSVIHVLTSPFKVWLQAETLELAAQERLEHWLALMREHNIHTGKALVRSGNAAEEIIAVARALHIDVIMIAADAKRTLLGSTAEAVVRSAEASVWVYHTQHFRGLRHIVCACDMSAASAKALQKATSLAEEYRAQLDVLYCLELPDTNTLGMSKEQAEETYRQHKAELRREFDNFVRISLEQTLPEQSTPEHKQNGLTMTLHVVWGKPSATIVEFARDAHADVIVLGAKGKSNLQILTLGSTAHNILRTARNSLLIVR